MVECTNIQVYTVRKLIPPMMSKITLNAYLLMHFATNMLIFTIIKKRWVSRLERY
jgi:hypothetical protein